MNLSLNILKEFVNLPGSSIEDLAQKLNNHTVEVEKISKLSEAFKKIVAGQILEVKKHPQADKLQIALVDVAEEKPLEIVCGAKNIAPQQMVPVAKIGAILKNGLEIKKAEIRGESSEGMLCSEDELGLGEDQSGIMILKKTAKPGQNLAEYLDLNDVILEIDNKSLSNRPDLWGHYGLARELSVLFSKKFKELEAKEIKIRRNKKEKNSENISINIKAKNLCPQYLALKIDNIKVEKSPQWLENKLKILGFNSVNNIVDIGNYVMLELGQPLHIFDASKIKKINIRRADKHEKVITLDQEERVLDDNDLVISEEKEILAIAGIIGAKNSQVNNTTNSIIIESANFDPVSLRKTAQKLKLRTEAVMRFEKGLDPNLCQIALQRTVELIKKVCPQALFKYEPLKAGDFKNEDYFINLNLKWLEGAIGHKIELKKIEAILSDLGFKIEKEKELSWKIGVPSWRQKDIKIKEDLLEEVVRIYGYNNIPAKLPFSEIIPVEKGPLKKLVDSIKIILSHSYQMSEAYNYSFVSEEQLLKLNLDPRSYLRLLNPLSQQLNLLRQTLTTNLIANIKNNQAKFERIALFEIGDVFLNISGGPFKDENLNESLPFQDKKLGLILAHKNKDVFSELKNIIYNLLLELGIKNEIEFFASETIINWADDQEKSLILWRDKEIGYLAKIKEEVVSKNGLKTKVVCSEINLGNLLSILEQNQNNKYSSPSRFPSVNRDLAFVISEKILYNDISREIKNFNPLIKKVELFDVYSGENLEKGKKSMAFHLEYQSLEKTLKTEEVEKINQELIKHLEMKFEAQIRNF